MSASIEKERVINIALDSRDLAPDQIRLLRSINCLLTQVLTAETEEEIFEDSAELMKLVANVIKQSQFVAQTKATTSIPYADQVIEYAIDELQEEINDAKLTRFDN